jgi:hypothetical protein
MKKKPEFKNILTQSLKQRSEGTKNYLEKIVQHGNDGYYPCLDI